MLAPASPAATREPLSEALRGSQAPAPAYESAARPNQAAALRALQQSSAERYAAAGTEFEISSSHFDATAVESVAASLRSLDHGPEMADITRPWSGPVTEGWSDSVAAPPASPSVVKGISRGRIGLAGGRSVGPLPWVAERRVRTPLDGNVSVSLTASPEADYVVTLRDPESGRALARAATAGTDSAGLSFSNCGQPTSSSRSAALATRGRLRPRFRGPEE